MTAFGDENTAAPSDDDVSRSTPAAATISQSPPLKGLRVVIMHIKDTMKDGPHVAETILAQLKEHAESLTRKGQPLGCEFEVAVSGHSYWF